MPTHATPRRPTTAQTRCRPADGRLVRAFLLAHVFLGPFTIFTIAAAFGYPLAGAVGGLAIGLAFCVQHYGAAVPPAFMVGQLVGLTAVVVALVADNDLAEHSALAIAFAFIALGALASVLQRKPWTAELSAGEYGDFAQSVPFHRVNMALSTMWAAIFGWFAVASWFELQPLLRWVPLAIGGIISVLGPRILTRIGIKRGIIADPAAPNR